MHRRREPPAAALEGEVRGLALEGEAQREELDEVVVRQVGDARPAVGLDADETLALEPAQRGAQRVARDVVGLDELALDEAPPGREVAVEDPRAQQAGELVDGRGAPQRLAARS